MTVALFLAGCGVPAEEMEARKAQFVGKPLSDVSAAIGRPSAQDRKQAIWTYKNSYVTRIPIQSLRNGTWVTIGYRNQTNTVSCTLTAQVSQGVVVSTQYEGNSCARFAPPLSDAA
ncbi:hypothetical protein [Aestuariivita boseongensis]|uniref:hypothetical protein n=1 Tax=Aestuariivita boseongensis TaxID=1470562 RepID=UPI001C0F82BB|nr:hypothetical protein [Aestuariivita boseongensis]